MVMEISLRCIYSIFEAHFDYLFKYLEVLNISKFSRKQLETVYFKKSHAYTIYKGLQIRRVQSL